MYSFILHDRIYDLLDRFLIPFVVQNIRFYLQKIRFLEHALGAFVGPHPRNSAADASGRPGVHLEASNNRLLGRVHDHRF